jgi:hypothetical protein
MNRFGENDKAYVLTTAFFFPDKTERQKTEREQREAREAEEAAKQEREAVMRLKQLRKQNPKSGDGAGEGTST